MAEWLLVILAIVGIVILGFFFSALDFFKGLTRFLIFGLLVFLLFLLANRFLPSIDSGQPYGRSNFPGGNFRTPNLDPNSDFSRSVQNLGERIDDFVFGSSEPSSNTSTPYPNTDTPARSRDFVYPVPGFEQEETIAEQPTTRSSSNTPQVTLSQPSTGTQSTGQRSTSIDQAPSRRPVSGLW